MLNSGIIIIGMLIWGMDYFQTIIDFVRFGAVVFMMVALGYFVDKCEELREINENERERYAAYWKTKVKNDSNKRSLSTPLEDVKMD